MAAKGGIRPDEGLMRMQELDDRLKEQIDKLEHVRLAAVELKDNVSGVFWAKIPIIKYKTNSFELPCVLIFFLFFVLQSNSDLTQSIADHLEWLNHLSGRVEALHMNTAVFVQVRNCFWWNFNHVQKLARRIRFLWYLPKLSICSSHNEMSGSTHHWSVIKQITRIKHCLTGNVKLCVLFPQCQQEMKSRLAMLHSACEHDPCLHCSLSTELMFWTILQNKSYFSNTLMVNNTVSYWSVHFYPKLPTMSPFANYNF